MDDQKLSLLERRFSFYASYHDHIVNQIIHIVCVPLIFWSALVMTNYIPLEWFGLGGIAPLGGLLPVNAALVPTVVYSTYYLILWPAVGMALVPLVFAALLGANTFLTVAGGALAWKVALGVHILGWAAQFYGHFVFEGRAPALFDSLLESLTMAPFFVFLEVLFSLGMLKGFKSRVDVIVKKRIATLNAEDARKKQ